MRLPNADEAIIDESKIIDYLLSESHPVGRFKAAFFAGLGFGPDNWREFGDRLRELAVAGDAEPAESTEYGQKYLVSGPIRGPVGVSAVVVTVWIVLTQDDKPRLITVYPR